MFYFPTPFNIDLKVDGNGVLVPEGNYSWFAERGQTMDDAFNLDFDFEISVFADEPVEMSITPPYLHQSSIFQYGFLASVKWDIGQWFRPIVSLFQLWPGVRELHLKEGEPIFYATFHTDRPIIFKQVRLTERVRNITAACLSHKQMYTKFPLIKHYEKFKRQGLRDDLLRELRENTIKVTDV
jgi:hypothetical protein